MSPLPGLIFFVPPSPRFDALADASGELPDATESVSAPPHPIRLIASRAQAIVAGREARVVACARRTALLDVAMATLRSHRIRLEAAEPLEADGSVSRCNAPAMQPMASIAASGSGLASMLRTCDCVFEARANADAVPPAIREIVPPDGHDAAGLAAIRRRPAYNVDQRRSPRNSRFHA